MKEALGSSLNAVRKAEISDAKLSGRATTLLHGILGMDVNEMRTTMIYVMPTIMHRDEVELAIRNVEAAIKEHHLDHWLQSDPLPSDFYTPGALEKAIASALSLNIASEKGEAEQEASQEEPIASGLSLNTASEESEAEQEASQESGVLQNSSGAVRAKAPGVHLSEALQNSSAPVPAKAPGMYLSSKPKANGLLINVPPSPCTAPPSPTWEEMPSKPKANGLLAYVPPVDDSPTWEELCTHDK